MAIPTHPMSAMKGTQAGRDMMAQVRAHKTKGAPVATITAADRRAAAAKGHALKDGSYPIRNTHELGAAATLAKSGHGNVAAAKALIVRRAKELGVANPLESEDTADVASEPGGEPANEKVAAITFMNKRRAAARN